ncbi:MAG: aldehyde dehydrogenase family protein, partial [Burkholderiales bacterium]|nr:aldehyde dehydrogenase family protein [Burkholderiales bacterium]
PPALLATDVGPVIDAAAQAGLEAHIGRMRATGHKVLQLPLPEECSAGTFVAPTLIELRSIAELEREVFGPVLHVVRYRREDLDRLLDDINATGYGLTLGVHSRIDETIALVVSRARAGNVYVNRNIVGAVVGVQPFGGEGKSGTGPKAGGPLYLQRLVRAPVIVPAALLASRAPRPAPELPALAALEEWATASGRGGLAATCRDYRAATLLDHSVPLPGPTGEVDTLRFAARGALGCSAGNAAQLLDQIAAALASGNDIVVEGTGAAAALLPQLPAAVRARIRPAADLLEEPVSLLLAAGAAAAIAQLRHAFAARAGALVPVIAADRDGRYPLHRLVVERSLSVNTAAAGGNASLMTLTP